MQLVRYKHKKYTFEIITKCGSVRLFLAGKLEWNNVLSMDAVFINYKKGQVAKNKDLISVFGTDDVNMCAQAIVSEGILQVSDSERKEDLRIHTQEVLGYLHRMYVDHDGVPHPLIRLEGVLEESKVRLDPQINVRKQAEEIIKKMLGKIVFKKNTIDYILKIQPTYNCKDIIQKYCPVYKRGRDDLWYICVCPSEFDLFISKLNKVTAGDYTINRNM
jgi:ribosome maturation protein Sdo1